MVMKSLEFKLYPITINQIVDDITIIWDRFINFEIDLNIIDEIQNNDISIEAILDKITFNFRYDSLYILVLY